MAVLSYREAAKQALAEELRADPLVWALGEDLGRGGVFGQYAGLIEEFGPRRIVDTPIAEATIMGASVGAAMVGTRPVVELRHADFALCAVDEVVNQAAKARYMFGGQARVPLVVRTPTGIRRASAAQHSQSFEAWWVQVPGLVVVAPATPADNKGLLKAAIRCDDPVIYLEHKELWELEGDVPDDPEAVEPLGVARLVREGEDITIVTWSRMRHVAEEATARLAEEGIAAELIDLRTLWPWDEAAVCASVGKTGRLLVVQEAVQVAGFAAEVLATVIERAGDALKARPRRLGAPRAPMPFSAPLENALRVNAAQIVCEARKAVTAGRD